MEAVQSGSCRLTCMCCGVSLRSPALKGIKVSAGQVKVAEILMPRSGPDGGSHLSAETGRGLHSISLLLTLLNPSPQ